MLARPALKPLLTLLQPHVRPTQVSAEDKAVRMAELAAERSQQLAELARLLGRRAA